MKGLVVLTLLAAGVFGWGAQNDQFQVDKLDEYFFKLLEGMNVHLNFENTKICKDATYDIKSKFLYDATIIIDRAGKFVREGIYELANTISVLPDFARHCEATASYMATSLMTHFSQFGDWKTFQKSFFDNMIYQVLFLKEDFEDMQKMAAENKFNEEFFLLLGQMAYRTFNFNKTTDDNLLLSPPAPLITERLLQTEQDDFVFYLTFTVEALRIMNILEKDSDLDLCNESMKGIDEQVTLGSSISADGDQKEGFFTMFDALKHVGNLVEGCLKTYDELVEDTLKYTSKVDSSSQLLLNVVGNFPDIIRHFYRVQFYVSQDKAKEAGQHLGMALSYLFVNFDIYQDFDDLP